MEGWYFTFLGRVHGRSGALQTEELMGKKTGALLTLLALAPGQQRSREELVDLLWPDADFQDARNCFRQIIHRLRHVLEPEGVEAGSVLMTGRTQVSLAAGHQSDVAEFEKHLRAASRLTVTEPLACAEHLRAALELYKGELAPGLYLDVLLIERERLAALAQKARAHLEALEASAATRKVSTVPPPLPTQRHSLPTENRFFGRTGEQDHLRALLQEYRLVTLLGPGGTGKTRLAQELLTTLPNAHFIRLSTLRNGASIPDALVTALALPDSTATALTRLQEAFVHQPTLLVLDNMEQLIERQGTEAITTLLTTIPTLRLLVTSRLRLHLPQECVCLLVPLPEEDALALFTDRARLARSTFEVTAQNAATITELCRRLDGLPLALELAAARIAVLTPQQILERLARRFELLTDKRRDTEERHVSLRAALDWGWSLLTPDLQRFFTRLCVFRGSFPLEAAEAITDEPLALDYLHSLADASFLLVEDERFVLLETLREYGLEKLPKEEGEALSHTHADYFLACTVPWRPLLVGPELPRGIACFKQEEKNLLAAIERMVALSPLKALQLCRGLTYYWHCTRGVRSGMVYMQQAIEAVERVGITSLFVAQFHQTMSDFYNFLGEPVLAFRHHQKHFDYVQQQLEECRAAGDSEEALLPLRHSLAGALHSRGDLRYAQGALDEAEQHFQEATALTQSLGDDVRRTLSLHGLYRVARLRGITTDDTGLRQAFFTQALHYAQEGALLCQRTKRNFDLCYFLDAQAYPLSLLNRHEEARACRDQGFVLACSLENWLLICWLLLGYARRAVQEARYPEAAQLQGAIAKITQLHPDVHPHTDDTHLFPVVDLPLLLGQECYDALYQKGLQSSLEDWKTGVAQI